MAYLLLACAFALNASANILLKLGAQKGFDAVSLNPLVFVVHNWQLLAGFVLFAANAFFYFLALRYLPLSIAYPIMIVMSFALINSYAFFVLAEPITIFQLCGYALIVLGLVLVVAHI